MTSRYVDIIHWLTAGALVAALNVLPGCTYQRVTSDGWSGLRQFAAESNPTAPVNASSTRQPFEGWTIHMAQLQGKNAQKQADEVVAYLEKRANVPDLWISERDSGVDVYRGRYISATETSAQNDLRQTRMLVINGARPYENVELIPLTSNTEARTMHPADLRSHVGMYSLQIAYFDDAFGGEYRKAAEDAVRTLRASNIEAFYYHGPNRSLVTAGLFTYSQAFMVGPHGQDTYTPSVLELQERFPCNTTNVCSLETQQRAKRQNEPASFLVKAP